MRVQRAIALTLFACISCTRSIVPSGFCAAPRSIAIELVVRDSVSGVYLADSATGTVTAMTYQDSLHHFGFADSLLWGGDQLGTYALLVQRPGYRDWTKSGVVVSQRASCGNVIPVQLNALLVHGP